MGSVELIHESSYWLSVKEGIVKKRVKNVDDIVKVEC